MASHTVTHSMYMQRALQLARLGLGHVSPNPMVGCVIVHNNQVIGEGYHQQYGQPHAEVNAINSVKNPELLSNCTLYVTLEPCCHYGKTPPCSELIISKKIKKVVIACLDPNPMVAGKGVAQLEKAGVEVIVGVLENEAKLLNKRFFTNISQKRPYIILKWAQSKYGYTGVLHGQPVWLTNAYSRQLVHQWRSQEDAVLVGYRTAIFDNPQLTVRNFSGRNPVRIVLDKNLNLPATLHVFNHQAHTIVINPIKQEKKENITYLKVDNDNLPQILKALYECGIGSVLVEGGTATLQKFISFNLWDEARVFYTQHLLSNGVKAPELPMINFTVEDIMGDMLYTYYK